MTRQKRPVPKNRKAKRPTKRASTAALATTAWPVAEVYSGAGAKIGIHAGAASVWDEVIEEAGPGNGPRIWCGTSAGALVAALRGQGRKGREILDILCRFTEADIHRRFGKLRSAWNLYFHRGAWDNSPLYRNLAIYLRPEPVKGVMIGVTAIGRTADGHPTAAFRMMPATLDAVFASMTMPLVWRPAALESFGMANTDWVDGGVRENTPLKPAIRRGARLIYVSMASPAPTELGGAMPAERPINGIDVAAAILNGAVEEITENDIAGVRRVNQGLALLNSNGGRRDKSRYHRVKIILSRPTEPSGGILEFTPEHYRRGFEIGRKAALAARIIE